MALVGLGIIPDEAVVGALVDFRGRWASDIGGPMLGKNTNIPHITIYQFPMNDSAKPDIPKDLDLPSKAVLNWSDLSYQPVGWVFANVHRQDWIQDYQSRVVEKLLPQVDPSLLKTIDNLTGYSNEEKDNYLAYGYRYVGDAFKPHVTMGRTIDDRDSISIECRSDFSTRFPFGDVVPLSKVVYYRAGSHGELVEVIHTVSAF